VSAALRSLQHLHLHFEPTSGIAGDMAVGALVDAGVPVAVIKGAIEAMGVRPGAFAPAPARASRGAGRPAAATICP
jgi:hypothetical protein